VNPSDPTARPSAVASPADDDPDFRDVVDSRDPVAATALELRRPDVPITLDQLAAHRDTAIAILTTRNQLWETAWLAALRRTAPPDWVLFRARTEDGGQIVGYLEDAGCDRVRGGMGIEIYNVSDPVKIVNPKDDTDFHYVQTADGFCRLTGERVYRIEGARSSKDDVCRDVTGTALDILVRKSTRANCDGNVVREFGFKSVAVEEIARAWAGTGKSTDHCRRGRGFGTRDERIGGRAANAPNIDPPVCPHCKTRGVYRPAKGDRKAFYGCPQYAKHPNQKFIVDAEAWALQSAARESLTPAQSAGFTTDPAPVHPPAGPPPTADEIFGGARHRDREPGEDG
jgi:hypothetical protein